MKLRIFTYVTAITLLAVLALPARSPAQEHKQRPPRYTVIDLGTLGGTFSLAGGLSNSGWVEGESTVPDDAAYHAFLWQKRTGMIDLGTLGGPNSFAAYRPSDAGDAGGGAEISAQDPDPNGEDYCGFGTHLICLAFFWRNDIRKMIPLPTLGGNNGAGYGTNNRAEVVGDTENTTQEPSCAGT